MEVLAMFKMIGVLILWYSAIRCTAMDSRELDLKLGQALMKTIVKHEIHIPAACDIMGVNESHFRSALKAEGYRRIHLNHVFRLGLVYPEFMVDFTATLMWLTVKENGAATIATAKMAAHELIGVARRA